MGDYPPTNYLPVKGFDIGGFHSKPPELGPQQRSHIQTQL